MSQQIAFIIPGYNEYTKEEKYQKIAQYFKKTGIKPILIDIKWQRHTMSDYVDQFLAEYAKYKAEQIYLLGFSFGAVICFIAATRVPATVQILCSLSPYFAEDLPHLKKSWKDYLGKKRIADFEQISSDKLAQATNCKTIMIAGEKEEKEVFLSNDRIFPQLKVPKERFMAKGAKHDIGDINYQKEIQNIIQTLK